jgi:hypothetical protein
MKLNMHRGIVIILANGGVWSSVKMGFGVDTLFRRS